MSKQKLVYGWGVNDADYPVCHKVDGNRKICPFYQTWRHMLQRVYAPKYQEDFPTYKGASVCDEWRYFMTFKAWMVEQDRDGMHLDKDLIRPGNKVYSPDTCCFVPQEINSLLLDCGAARGEYPQGVSWDKKKGRFKANISKRGKTYHLGMFSTPEAAHAAYVKSKVLHIWGIAMSYPNERVRDGLTMHCFKLQGVM